MKVQTFSTLPTKNGEFWQIVVIPTITILRSPDKYDPYTAVSFEWLFWSCTFLIK